MAISTKVGAFNTGTGAVSTTVPVTGTGFQPKVVIFWWTGRTETTDAIGRLTMNLGMGVAISSTERWANSSYSLDASAAAETSRRMDNASCVVTIDAVGALTGALDVQSMDSDGFTLIVDDVMPYSMRVHYLALGGTDLTNYAANYLIGPTITGNYDITSVGFQPDFVLFASTGMSSNPPVGGTATDAPAYGFAVSNSAQVAYTGNSDDGSTTMDTDKYLYAGECCAIIAAAGGVSVWQRDSFVSFLSNGFRLNRVEGTTATRFFYLALKGGSYRIDNLLTKTDVTDIVETGFGFSPKAAMFMGHMTVQSTVDTTQLGKQLSLGAFSSITDRGVQCCSDADSVADSIVTTGVNHVSIYESVDSAATPAIVALMDIKSVDSDGF